MWNVWICNSWNSIPLASSSFYGFCFIPCWPKPRRTDSFFFFSLSFFLSFLFNFSKKKKIVRDLLDLNKYPNRPAFQMASEIPLVLYDCAFEDVVFNYEQGFFFFFFFSEENDFVNSINELTHRSPRKKPSKIYGSTSRWIYSFNNDTFSNSAT